MFLVKLKRCVNFVFVVGYQLKQLIANSSTNAVVSESRVTWATSVPILVFLGLSVLDLARCTRETERRQTGGGITIVVQNSVSAQTLRGITSHSTCQNTVL